MQRQKSGSIVNIASIGSFMGIANMAAFCASKGGLVSLSNCVAAQCYLENNGIRSNVVIPGLLHSDTHVRAVIEPLNVSNIPLRIGNPEEVAKCIIFLSSDDSTRINGASIRVDGGDSVVYNRYKLVTNNASSSVYERDENSLSSNIEYGNSIGIDEDGNFNVECI